MRLERSPWRRSAQYEIHENKNEKTHTHSSKYSVKVKILPWVFLVRFHGGDDGLVVLKESCIGGQSSQNWRRDRWPGVQSRQNSRRGDYESRMTEDSGHEAGNYFQSNKDEEGEPRLNTISWAGLVCVPCRHPYTQLGSSPREKIRNQYHRSRSSRWRFRGVFRNPPPVNQRKG